MFMLMPSIFGERLIDSFMDDFGFSGLNKLAYGRNSFNLMRTDVKEVEEGYQLDIDLPGFKKDDVKIRLKEGYLTVNVKEQKDDESKDDKGRYLRRERYAGSMSRSFFVGENLDENDIHAKFEDGILKLTFPKEEPKKIEEARYIAIEG